ncbi:MAG: hypothetical protein JSR46_04030 [Verrucomicrobia bacterium]|nr:hypothetical protein [Verrucomicrobiota bacterium]
MENSDSALLVFDRRKEDYLQRKQALFAEYMQRDAQQKELNLFFCLNSSAETHQLSRNDAAPLSIEDLKNLLTNPFNTYHNGGYLLRWNKKSIVINPTRGFLERFCELGHHLWDIDAVIVTSPEKSSSHDLELIHSLNRELNSTLVSYDQEPHVIRYLLHPVVYAQCGAILRPHFREEKGTVICLETFQDGYAEEVYALDSHSKLWYSKRDSSLMIRLELYKEPDQEESPSLSFGYLADSQWDDTCAAFFKGCEVLLAGFGKTCPEDLENIKTQTNSIGYWGLSRAAKKLPKLQALLVGEFCPCQGDIRIAVIKKLKKQISGRDRQPTLLPLEQGFILDLDTMKINTGTKLLPPYQFCACDEVHVVQSEESFGPLLYLSKELVL